MPLPRPHSSESRPEFLQRCMNSATMRSEFPDETQRYAVCISQLPKDKAYQQRSWNTTQRYRAQFRRKYLSIFQKSMDRMVRPIFEELLNVGADTIVGQMDSLIQETELRNTYHEFYREVGTYFAKLDFKKTKSIVGNITVKSPVTGMTVKQSEEEEILEDVWAAGFYDYVDNKLGDRIVSVTGDTKKLFQKYLNELLKEDPGLGGRAQAMNMHDKLMERYSWDRRWRLQRIVRTETTTASNVGSIIGMDSTGYDYEKEWIAAFVNTRDDHAEVHGQRVSKNDFFRVGSDQMEYPGDPGASAENVVNCMCTHSFHLIR